MLCQGPVAISAVMRRAARMFCTSELLRGRTGRCSMHKYGNSSGTAGSAIVLLVLLQLLFLWKGCLRGRRTSLSPTNGGNGALLSRPSRRFKTRPDPKTRRSSEPSWECLKRQRLQMVSSVYKYDIMGKRFVSCSEGLTKSMELTTSRLCYTSDRIWKIIRVS